MDFFVWFILIILVMVGIVIALMINDSNRRKDVELALSRRGDFTADDSYSHSQGGIAVDTSRGLIRLATNPRSGLVTKIVAARDVIEVQIQDSGTVVAQSGGGIIGGAIGGVGIGYMGSRKGKMTVRVSLRVYIKDPNHPAWEVPFMELSETKASTAELLKNEGLKLARHWYGVITALAQLDELAPEESERTDLSGRLKELAAMYQEGLLDDDEYRAAKARLLSEPSE